MKFEKAAGITIKKRIGVKLNKGDIDLILKKFPFFIQQYKKNKSIVNDIFNIYYDDNTIVSYITYKFNKYNDLFNFETIHLSDLEVSEENKGKGYFKMMMSDFLEKFNNAKITLQANTQELINTYKKYGFNLYGDPKETGNLMINWEEK